MATPPSPPPPPSSPSTGAPDAPAAPAIAAGPQAAIGHDPDEAVGPGGVIVTGARHSRLAPAFGPLLQQAIAALVAQDAGASLYVYGSVATGRARIGQSDVDLLTIGLPADAARQLGATLSQAHRALCRGVEVGAAQPSDHAGAGDEAHGNRVFLRHYAVHLAGPDPARSLPDYPADRAAARGFNGDIGRLAQHWAAQAEAGADPALLARRIARKTLFAVAGLVSVHDATWTTDRAASARRWAQLRPGLAPALRGLVDWAGGGATGTSTTAIQQALGGVVAAVVDDFARHIGLWDGG